MRELPTLKPVNLKHEGADGIWYPDGHIEIERTLRGRRYLETLIHEMLHELCNDWSERKTDRTAKKLTAFLWRHRVRVIETNSRE